MLANVDVLPRRKRFCGRPCRSRPSFCLNPTLSIMYVNSPGGNRKAAVLCLCFSA